MGFGQDFSDLNSGQDDIKLKGGTDSTTVGNVGDSLKTNVTNFPATQPVSAASLPLPAGASTAALQTSGNASLAAIDAGIPAALGQTTAANSMPVVLPSDQVVTVTQTRLATFAAIAIADVPGNNKSMISLVNTGASVVKIREIKLKNVQNTSVTGVVVDFGLRRITGHSAGTLLTPETHDTNDSLAGTITARIGSTVTGESATQLRKWEMSSDEWGVGTADSEADIHSLAELFPFYSDYMRDVKPITIRQNQGVTIKCQTNTIVGSFDILILFTVE